MNPETTSATSTTTAQTPTATQPVATPNVVSVTPTNPTSSALNMPKPAAPRLGKKHRNQKNTPLL